MTTSEKTAAMETSTEKKMLHRWRNEKLGLEEGWFAMLFPAAGLHHAQSQKEKPECQGHVKHDVPRVHHSAGEVIHLVEQRHVGKHLRHPPFDGRKMP